MSERCHPRKSLADRFHTKVGPSDAQGCTPWLAGRSKNKGYGRVHSGGHKGKLLLAHRVAWELTNGPIPKGLCVLHKCDNKLCVNPDHLFLGTNKDNTEDMIRKGRHRCGRGDRHGSKTHPDCVARGDRHGLRLHPERAARGDKNGSRKHPECLRRGESNPQAKLTQADVLSIRRLRKRGWQLKSLARKYRVSFQLISMVASGQIWQHVPI
jgi:hypothetical protein